QKVFRHLHVLAADRTIDHRTASLLRQRPGRAGKDRAVNDRQGGFEAADVVDCQRFELGARLKRDTDVHHPDWIAEFLPLEVMFEHRMLSLKYFGQPSTDFAGTDY